LSNADFSIKDVALKIGEFFTKRVPMAFLVGLALIMLMPYILQHLTRGKIALQPPAADKSLGIKELVGDVKSELYQLEKDRVDKKEEALFEVTNFDLEISFIVRASSKQSGKVEYQVVTADTELQQGIEKIQKLTLHMKTVGEKRLPAEQTAFPSAKDLGDVQSVDQPPPKKGERP
jgi:hypothetical protein